MIEFRRLVDGVRNVARFVLRGTQAVMMSLGITALLLNTACYTYNAYQAAELASGQRIVVTLNEAGRQSLATELGDSVARAEGDVVSVSASGVRMRVTDVEFMSESSAPRSHVDVTIPNSEFNSVTTRRLSIPRTAALTAVIVAGLVALIRGINVDPSGSPAAGETGPPPLAQ
jgi:hypothetical protein